MFVRIVHIHTYINIYVYIQGGKDALAFIRIYIHTFVHIQVSCIHKDIHTYIHTCAYRAARTVLHS